MAAKQESLHDYYEMAKEIAKVEKELNIEQWVKINIGFHKDGKEFPLWSYDLPVWLYRKKEWVVRWRKSRFQCLYPKEFVELGFFYYKKVMGVNIGMQKDIDTFVAAKAQLTKQRNIVNDYIERKKAENDLFYDMDGDEMLQKALVKLQRKEAMVRDAENRMIEKVKSALKTTT